MLDVPLSPAVRDALPDGLVVLLDQFGRPCGTAAKSTVHHERTPLHLAFSCYVVGGDGRVLLTRRAAAKATWPSVWTNACCGHPRPGETLRQAVERHLRDELGVAPSAMALAVPDFTYRAVMSNGTVEHEVCPVVVAMIDAPVTLAPDEADGEEWVGWTDLVARAEERPASLSPWSVRQIAALARTVGDPSRWICNGARRSRPAAVRPSGPAAGPGAGSISTPAQVLTPFGQRFDELLEEFLADRRERLAALDPLAAEVGDAVSGLIRAGGKRLRPAFAYWGHQAGAAGGNGTRTRTRTGSGSGTGTDSDGVVRLGLALEMLHTFALIHDDVMDRSRLRRGTATVHEQFATLRGSGRAAGWFGSSAAIVAGDLAFVWSDELLDAACDGRPMRRLREAYAQLRTEVIAGQYLDLRHGGSAGRATPADAVSVALLKSGRYTVTRPLEVGALLGGAEDCVIGDLRRYGDATGLAFQLRDDVLGLFGAPDVTGKGATEDIREGKQTLLVLRALELADDAGRAELERVLRTDGHDDERLGDGFAGWPDDGAVERCRDIVATSGALASVEALITAQVAIADEATTGLEPTVADALRGLARLLTARVA